MKKLFIMTAMAVTLISCGKKTESADSNGAEAEAKESVKGPLPTSYEKIYAVLTDKYICDEEGGEYKISYNLADIIKGGEDEILIRVEEESGFNSYCVMSYDKATDTPTYVCGAGGINNDNEEELKLGYVDNFVVVYKKDSYDFDTETTCKQNMFFDLRDYNPEYNPKQIDYLELQDGTKKIHVTNITWYSEEEHNKIEEQAKKDADSILALPIQWITSKSAWAPVEKK